MMVKLLRAQLVQDLEADSCEGHARRVGECRGAGLLVGARKRYVCSN